jgi:hypothetical protein
MLIFSIVLPSSSFSMLNHSALWHLYSNDKRVLNSGSGKFLFLCFEIQDAGTMKEVDTAACHGVRFNNGKTSKKKYSTKKTPPRPIKDRTQGDR